MKKFTLFLVAIFAMVNVANAQRAWAYDLGLTSESESYTFAFKAVTAGDATLVFYKEGVEAGTLNLGSVSAGDNTVTKTSEELLEAIQQSGDFTWGVKMTGEAIAEGSTLKEVTDQTRGIYDFYNMMDVLVDNNPESDYFGKIYIQMALNGKSDGATTRSDNQKAGLFIYDQELNELNPTSNVGIKPTLPSGYTLGDDRNKFHRLEIDPKTGNLAYCYNVSGSPAVFSIDRANPTGLVTNLIDGISGFTQTCALCFDAEGTLYVMDLASSKGTIYKVVDGQKTAFSETTGKWVNVSMSLASDGRGGLWVSQNRGQIDTYYQLVHYNASGTVDFAIYDDLGTYVAATKDNPGKLGTSSLGWLGSSSRGALAYDAERQILAQGRIGAVELFNVTYNASGVPTLTKFAVTPSVGNNIDGLHFDYAGDLYVVNSSKEKFQKFEVPTNNNTCTTPAKKSQVITLVSTTPEYSVTINVNGNGTVTGANTGTYLEGTELTLTPTPAEHYEFTGWTGDVESTDNPLTVIVDGNKNITANFAKKQYTLTVSVNDGTKGSVNPTSGTYAAESEVQITAVANPGYEFTNWSNGSKTNPLTISMEEDTELTANFRAILPTSITLNAHPTKDYSASIVGTMKRAIQNGENTIVLTHEANGTAHIYNIAHTTKTITEISQEGVVAVDPDNAGDLLAISDIALTDDGKLVACNYVVCQFDKDKVETGYKRGTSHIYIWNDLAGNPEEWLTSQKTGNYNVAYMGHTMALKGTSQNAAVTISAFNKSNSNTRYSHLYVVDGTYTDASYKYSRDNVALHPNTLGKNTYELNASPLAAGKWIVDGELASPIEFVEKNAIAIDTYTALNTNVLGKKYNGASYLFHKDHHLMIAPYAGADDKLAGVKVLGISDGFDAATLVTTATDLTTAIDATTAAATAYVDGDGDLTIYLIADGKVYTFSEKEFTTPQYTINAHADHTSKGYVTGGGDYYEGEEVVLKATAKSGYYFTQWNDGNTNNPRTITVTDDVEYIAEFAEAYPRAWAYDMKLGEEGDNYTFTFKATTAGQATITFNDKDGNALAQPASQIMTAVAGENKFTIAKSDFESGVDAFWSITMDGDPIPAIAEVTDQTRGIYDFYNMMGVVVDNNTDSKDFGKIYIQQSYERSYASSSTSNNGITTRANDQKSGIFIYNQALDELNSPSNVGIKPTIPSGYTEIGSSSSAFQRLNIDPKTGNLVFSHAVSGKPAVFAINRDDMTGDVTNLLTGVADMTRSVAHCFDAEGTLYVMDFAGSSTGGAVYKVINGEATRITEISAKFVNAYITMASDGRGGLWIGQNRGQMDDAPYYYQLVHVTSTGEFDWYVNKETPHGFEGSSSRGALAYDVERNILAQGRNGKVELYTVSYEPTITLTPLHTIASNDLGNNIDGLAFDYAGDLYVVNSSKEKFQKFTLPTADNICTVAAPALEAIRSTPVYTVSVESNNNEWGIVSGGGTFEEGETATITATAATNYKFVNWTKEGAEVSTENPYAFAVTESATYVANFEEITKYTINVTIMDDAKMGTVEGAGTYYEGTEVTLTAKANAGYVFVDWSDGNTEETRTFTAGVDLPETLTANFKVAVPRAWAYDLRLDADTDPANYIFTFKTTSAGTATLNFKDKNGTISYTHSADVATGKTTIKIAKSTFDAANKDIYWEVELAGEAIAKMAELTDPTEGIYNFYVPQGVAVDNSPNSMYFGRIYVAEGTTGANDGGSEMAKQMTAGLFVYNQALEKVQPATGYTGIIPQNVTFNTNKPTSTDEINIIRQQMHRVAVDPVTGEVAFAYYKSPATAIYSMNPDDLAGNAQNLIEGSSITYANSLCFDSEGTLYVMNNANTGLTGGQIYKVQDDEVTLFAAHDKNNQWAVYDNAMASDGRGGLWIAQNRYAYDYPILSHVNKEGEVDFAVKENLNGWFPNNNTGSSYRGQLAYNEQEDILAFAGNKMVTLFTVEYDGNGKPTINKLMSTPLLGGGNIDGVAFDYAGDLYVASASAERLYKFVVPTNTNTCTVPAPESQFIQKETRYTVTVVANPAEGGIVSVSDDGNAVEGATLEVTATANDGYRFVNWTKNAEEVSTSASFDYTVPAEDVTLTANFAPLPEITYELNGGVWNKYGWTSKKDMYNALLDDWRAYSGSARTNVSYEEQLGIGNSSKGIPTTVTSAEDRVALMELFTDATYATKWGWLATYVDAVAATQYKKMDAANGAKTQPTSGAGVLTYTIGNFFGEDNAHSTDYIDAVDFTGEEAHITAFAPYWGQTFPMPTQPTEEVVLNAPYKEGYEFDGWYANSDFSGAAVTTVDENTDGTLYAKWIETIITVTIDENAGNTTILAPYDDKTVTATVTRNFGANKILTVTLPFDMSASQISTHFGNATVYEFYNVVDAGEELHLQFAHTNSIEAGKPYILQTTTSEYDAEDGFTIENVTINTELTQVKIGDLTMVPVLDGGGTLNQPTQYYLSNNALYCAGDYERPLPGLRAFFTSATSTPIRARVIFDDNGATSIPTVIAPETKAQKIIKDGRLIIIRGEHQYNAQGQMIE